MDDQLIQKAKTCNAPEELLALAKENGIEMTEEQAKDYLAKLNPANREIADEELENVSGGGCGNPYYYDSCEHFEKDPTSIRSEIWCLNCKYCGGFAVSPISSSDHVYCNY